MQYINLRMHIYHFIETFDEILSKASIFFLSKVSTRFDKRVDVVDEIADRVALEKVLKVTKSPIVLR